MLKQLRKRKKMAKMQNGDYFKRLYECMPANPKKKHCNCHHTDNYIIEMSKR